MKINDDSCITDIRQLVSKIDEIQGQVIGLMKFQNKGIGAEVLSMVKRRAQQLTLPVTLNVLLNNPAVSLYLRNGFTTISENDFEYQLIYQATL